MSKYIDLVLCKHDSCDKNYLFLAPAWSGLKEDDDVIVETSKGEQFAKVIRTLTVEPNKEDYNFIMFSANLVLELPLKKVLKKVSYHEFEYEEDNENE